MDPLEDYYAALVYFHNNDSDVIRNLKYSILFPYMPTFKCDTEELFPGEHDYRKAFTSGKLGMNNTFSSHLNVLQDFMY